MPTMKNTLWINKAEKIAHFPSLRIGFPSFSLLDRERAQRALIQSACVYFNFPRYSLALNLSMGDDWLDGILATRAQSDNLEFIVSLSLSLVCPPSLAI